MIPGVLRPSAASLKTELTIVGAFIFVLIMLPLITVVSVADAGITAVSNVLVAIDPISHLIELRDPNGKVVKELQATTSWPAKGPVSLEFGQPDPPYQAHHTGIDIAGKYGQPITPFMAGSVTLVDQGKSGYGKYVELDNGNGITSIYAHMSQTLASVGTQVKPGDDIGLEGSTGHSTGPHVHFEIRLYDIPVNPRTFMVGDPSL